MIFSNNRHLSCKKNSGSSRVELEVDKPNWSTYLLEADWATGSAYLLSLYKLSAVCISFCMSVSFCHLKTTKLLDISGRILLYLTAMAILHMAWGWWAAAAHLHRHRLPWSGSCSDRLQSLDSTLSSRFFFGPQRVEKNWEPADLKLFAASAPR